VSTYLVKHACRHVGQVTLMHADTASYVKSCTQMRPRNVFYSALAPYFVHTSRSNGKVGAKLY